MDSRRHYRRAVEPRRKRGAKETLGDAATYVSSDDTRIRQTDDDTGVSAVVYGNSYFTDAAARTPAGLYMVMIGK